MGRNGVCWVFCVVSALLLHMSGLCRSQQDSDDRNVYIVYMGSIPEAGTYSPDSAHLSVLQDVVGEGSVSASLVRSYKRSFNGFAAKLTASEAKRIAAREDVASVFPSRTFHVQTTASWDFVGLHQKAKRDPSVESNIITGVLDSGVWPESESFTDKGFRPPPKKWKGVCEGGTNFTCNNKIIGARYYTDDNSARDSLGHGSHTASTAAGNSVNDVNFYGLANGTARGGVPSARIAVYKVCNNTGSCEQSDILAGFDDAIADGVDIITASLGGNNAVSFDTDAVAIGGFHAMEGGILTTQSAGNSGPFQGSVASVAPWLFTVGSSTTNRGFNTTLVLGNFSWTGNTINTFASMNTSIPVVHGLEVTSTCDAELAGSCNPSCLDSKKVKGKIVLCDEPDFGIPEAVSKGAAGVIAQCGQRQFGPEPFVAPIPLLCFDTNDYEPIIGYFNATKNMTGRILRSEDGESIFYPVVSFTSSRGPNRIVRDITKPDITAPGLNILAAFSPVSSPSFFPLEDKRSVKYNFMSGTSMAAPHVAGAAAYVKSFHPDWSPAAIKSALMTTAGPMHFLADPDGYGSGHLNPVAAADPGLVYDIEKEDYVRFLCSLDYNVGTISSNRSSRCSKELPELTPGELNYPALSFRVPNRKSHVISLNRTVTNVGPPNSSYRSILPDIDPRQNLQIQVVPRVLRFKSVNEKQTFEVIVSGKDRIDNEVFQFKFAWSDGTHDVTSTITVYSMAQ